MVRPRSEEHHAPSPGHGESRRDVVIPCGSRLSQHEMPEEITLTLEEAKAVLLALYDARDDVPEDNVLYLRLSEAIRTLRFKLAPELPECTDVARWLGRRRAR